MDYGLAPLSVPLIIIALVLLCTEKSRRKDLRQSKDFSRLVLAPLSAHLRTNVHSALHDYGTPREATQRLAMFFVRYNEHRQHSSLGYQTPAAVYFDVGETRIILS